MAKLEKILVVLLGISLLMRFLRWDGGSFISLIAGLVLSMLYFFLGFLVLSGGRRPGGDVPAPPAPAYVAGGIAGVVLATAVVAVVYTTLGWFGADIMRIAALVGLVMVFGIVLALRKSLPDGGRGLLTRGMIATVVLVTLSFMPPFPQPAIPTDAPAPQATERAE